MKKLLYSSKYILLLAFVFITISSNGQTAKLVYGKIYYQSRNIKSPASFKRVVLMPRNNENLKMAQDLYNPFDDKIIKSIRGARTVTTNKNGDYQFNSVGRGDYIIRVTGMGGMVIKFSVPTNTNIQLKIPDMPADYYYKRINDYTQTY